MTEELTVEELRELADAGDVEAQEALAEQDATAEAKGLARFDGSDPHDDEFAEAVAAHRDDLLGEADEPQETLTAPAPTVPAPAPPYAAATGETVYVNDGDAVGVVRVARGRGVVTLEDGRTLRPGEYRRLENTGGDSR